MLSALVLFLLFGLASSTIEFLSPSSGQEFATNQSIPIKWNKVAGAFNYSVNGNSSDGSNVETFKEPTRCKPRVWIGPLQEGYWDVLVEARNQSGEVIDSGWISFRICQSLPCPNGTEAEEACTKYDTIRMEECTSGLSSADAASVEECCTICVAAANAICQYNSTASSGQCSVCTGGSGSFVPTEPGNTVVLMPKQG